MSSVRVSNSYLTKRSLIGNEDLKNAFNEIEKCVETPVMMLGVTGHQDYRDLAQHLFEVVALLEMQGQAQMNLDSSIMRAIDKEKEKGENASQTITWSTIDYQDENSFKLNNKIAQYIEMIKAMRNQLGQTQSALK